MKTRNRLSTNLRVIGTLVVGGSLLALAAPPAFAAYADVTTLAGSGVAGSANGAGAAASFKNPEGIATDSSGDVFVADSGNNMIRKITPGGVVSTFAGSVTAGNVDATGTAASFRAPRGMAFDTTGNLYVADSFNNTIRRITSAGVVSTFAGSGLGGSADANGTAASFNRPSDVAYLTGNLYVADTANNKIRVINSAGDVTTLAGSGVAAFVNGSGPSASFNYPGSLSVDLSGNVFVADYFNNVIRKVTPMGVVTTFAGSGAAITTDGTGTAAAILNPSGITTDGTGTMYITERNGVVIRKMTSAAVVTTLAGGAGGTTLDGNGTAAGFNAPQSIAADAFGHLYVTEDNGNVIRRIDISGSVPVATTTTVLAVTTTTTTLAATTTTTNAPSPTTTTTVSATPLVVAPSIVPGSVVVTTTAPATAASPATTITTTTIKAIPTTVAKTATVAPAAIAGPATSVSGEVAYTG